MDVLVHDGGAVKALGNGKVGGYLVRFGDADTTDTSRYRDYFTPETDFGVDEWPVKSAVYYHHGLDPKLGKRRLAAGEIKTDEHGLWIEAQLALRDEWERSVYALAEAGKLGWSSGTALHLIDRTAVKAGEKTIAHQIERWPLGLDASLTPTPAEPRCDAYALKSTSLPTLEELLAGAEPEPAAKTIWGANGQPESLAEHAAAVVKANAAYAERLESRLEARTQAGRTLTQANRTELESVLAVLDDTDAVKARIRALLDATAATKTLSADDAAPLSLERLRLRARASLALYGPGA